VRTLCEAQNYAYSVSDKGVWFHIYGGSHLETALPDGSKVQLTQTSDYPWDGKVRVNLEKVSLKKAFSMFLRIPEWCEKATLLINGKAENEDLKAGTYAEVNRQWKKGDVIELELAMTAKLLESNPLVEETRNQTVIKRGPLVYCLESIDVEGQNNIDNVLIPADIKLTPKKITIEGSPVVCLEGTAGLMPEASWKNTLYRPVSAQASKKVNIRLIPYYAWGNRGKADMTVWMPLAR
jgi:Uncharacterized protein conserved in bacteria